MDEFEAEIAQLPVDQMQIHLVIVCDDDAGEFVQEWVTAYARDIRLGLGALEYDAEITLTTSDGVFEQH
jgi:hypothetical protein